MSTRPSSAVTQRGFTLVEVLVALTIGLLLTIVVAQLFLGSRQTLATTDDVARQQENIRFAYQLLTRTLHHGGFRTSPNTLVEEVFVAPNLVVAGADGATAIAPDTFTVRYQGNSNGNAAAADGTIHDCLGNAVAAGVTATNVFTIGIGQNGNSALFCNNVEIVADVANMQVLYGVDTDTNMVVDTYAPAAAVVDMDQVRAIRIALLFQTSNAGAIPVPSTLTYDLNGVVVGPFNDTFIRRPVTMTINMRNRTP